MRNFSVIGYIISTLLCFAASSTAIAQQPARFYVKSDSDISVRVSAPIDGYSQEAFPDAEFKLTDGQMSLTELEIAEGCEVAMLDVTSKGKTPRYLKFLIFEGDSVVLSYTNDTIEVSGSNSEGHNLFLNKVRGLEPSQMPTNQILKDMEYTIFKDMNMLHYDTFIDYMLIEPLQKEFTALVEAGSIDPKFAHYAMACHTTNIYSFILFELREYFLKLDRVSPSQKRELKQLQERLEREQFTASIDEVAAYSLTHSYAREKAKTELNKLSEREKKKKFAPYYKPFKKLHIEEYLVYPEKLQRLLLTAWYNRAACDPLFSGYTKELESVYDMIK